MKVGSWDVTAIEAGRFRLDGGAMFGVVPRPLWSRSTRPDERNRIQMVTRCLLARGEGRTVLVDTGTGGDWDDKERDIYAIEDDGGGLSRALAARGVAEEQVTDVVLTHLHFDHAGGGVTRRDGAAVPAFPAARYHVQAAQLAWALHPTERDRRSYRAGTFVPLLEQGRLSLVEGPAEILPGIRVEPTEGHTAGHQVVVIGEGRDSVMFCGDLVPMAAHLPTPWVMGYDLFPVTTMKEKRELLGRAADEQWVLVLEHDPESAAVRVAREKESFRSAGPVGID